MRPSPSRLLAGSLAALLLAGCGSSAGQDATGAGTADDDAFPVIVEHAYGSTTVESEPRRVVTVGYTDQDFVLALDVVPVGITDWYGEQPHGTWPWAQDELGDAEPELLTTDDGIQFERIAALDPDLIVGVNAGMSEEDYATLSEIAPTLAHLDADTPYFDRWDDQTIAVGTALGRAEEAGELVDELSGRFAEEAAAHPEFAGTSIAFLQNAVYDGSYIAYQDGLSTAFLTDLGFTVPAELEAYADDLGTQAFIPLEQAAVLDAADVLLWATEAPEDRTALESEGVYRALRAVQEGHLAFTDGELAGAIYFTSPLSLPYVLDELVPLLAGAVAGDPSTIPS